MFTFSRKTNTKTVFSKEVMQQAYSNLTAAGFYSPSPISMYNECVRLSGELVTVRKDSTGSRMGTAGRK